MKKWLIKAIVQKIVSYFPCSFKLNYYIQRHLTVGKELPGDFFLERIESAQKHIKSLNKYGSKNIESIAVLEIGTGWYPIVPIVFYLSGANYIETADIRKLYSEDSINTTINAFIRLFNNNSITKYIPQFKSSRIDQLELALKKKSVSEKMALMKIKGSLLKTLNSSNSDSTKDFIVSNNTIQMVPQRELASLLSDLKRIGKSGSLLSIDIDLTDEFSHFDKSINEYNFLKFSQSKWNRITCDLNSTNRLRFSEYQKLFLDKFQLVSKDITSGNPDRLKKIKIHESFASYNTDDLLVTYLYTVLMNKKKR